MSHCQLSHATGCAKSMSNFYYSIKNDMHSCLCNCSPIINLRNELFFLITKSDPSFMHLDIFDKFLYILSSENNTCTIAKFIYKMFKFRCSFLYHT